MNRILRPPSENSNVNAPARVNAFGVTDFSNPLGLDYETIQLVRKHAMGIFPNEMCGIIANSTWFPAPNVASDPATTWEISEDFQLQFDPSDIQGVIHSHCHPHRPEPSKFDMSMQINSAVPWGIVLAQERWASKPLWWGDFRLAEPLVGRPFIHGVSDCYSAIRSWYWQKRGIYLKDFPRSLGWYEHETAEEEDLYAKQIGQYGVRVGRDEVVVGDVALFKMLYRVPSHAAIVTENGLMYHHIANSVSGEVPLGKYIRFAVSWYHYTGGGEVREAL